MIHAAFVAEARRVYVPAARQLRALGWTPAGHNKELRLSIYFGIKADWYGPFITVNQRGEHGLIARSIVQADVTSLTQAIGILRAAGIIPWPEDRSDIAGDRWTWHPAGYFRGDDGEPLTAFDLEDGFGPTEAVA